MIRARRLNPQKEQNKPGNKKKKEKEKEKKNTARAEK